MEVVAIDADKLGRTVTVERATHEQMGDMIALSIGGRGKEKWTWLSDHEALIIANALYNECGGEEGYSLRDARGRVMTGEASEAEQADLVRREAHSHETLDRLLRDDAAHGNKLVTDVRMDFDGAQITYRLRDDGARNVAYVVEHILIEDFHAS